MSKRRVLISTIVLLLLAVIGAGAYYFRSQITDFIKGINGDNKGDENGEEITCEDQVYTNTRQGYKVCYKTGWYTQEFGYSQLLVGFDAFPIPTASEYAGVFNISVSRQNSATLLAQYLSSLKDPETAAASIGGVTGIRIDGAYAADDVFFPNYRQSAAVVENAGRTYSIVMLSSPDGFVSNKADFEKFLSSFQFLEDTAAAPWGKNIYLNTPWPNDEVSDSFRIAGSAQGAFENTIVARLKTESGTVLFEEPIIYNAPEVGELGYFDIAVTFQTTSESGTLEVFYTSPKDGSVADLVSVPLKFK